MSKLIPWLVIGAIVGAFLAVIGDGKPATVPPAPGPRKRKPVDKAKHLRKVTPPPDETPPPDPQKPNERKVET